tara:strand:- start:572 stop:742 length:171 start_codon:yes stop_codon:yes gene_type:complete
MPRSSRVSALHKAIVHFGSVQQGEFSLKGDNLGVLMVRVMLERAPDGERSIVKICV